MKIILTHNERKVLDILFTKVATISGSSRRISDFGITVSDPELHVDESFTISWMCKAIERLDKGPAMVVNSRVRTWYDKFLKFLTSVPKGTLAKNK